MYIPSPTVRLLDETREQIGVVSAGQAKEIARDRGLDLFPVNENAEPPVYMVGDYGKYMYTETKAKKEQAKKNRAAAKAMAEKEVHLPCDTSSSSENDRRRILGQANDFLADGHPVKIRIAFNGRKITHLDDAMPRIEAEIRETLTDGNVAKIEYGGRYVFVNCTPRK